VYIINPTSHPLILGTEFLRSKHIYLDFSNNRVQSSKCNVKCKQTTDILPNSEVKLWAKAPTNIPMGTQGLCTISSHVQKSGVLIAKAVVSVTLNHVVLIKVLNPTSSPVTLHRSNNLTKVSLMDMYEIITNMLTTTNTGGVVKYHFVPTQ